MPSFDLAMKMIEELNLDRRIFIPKIFMRYMLYGVMQPDDIVIDRGIVDAANMFAETLPPISDKEVYDRLIQWESMSDNEVTMMMWGAVETKDEDE